MLSTSVFYFIYLFFFYNQLSYLTDFVQFDTSESEKDKIMMMIHI